MRNNPTFYFLNTKELFMALFGQQTRSAQPGLVGQLVGGRRAPLMLQRGSERRLQNSREAAVWW